MVCYTDSLAGITPEMLVGFFEGWPNPPSPPMHLQLLRNSSHVVLAVDDKTRCVAGFITAISDGVLFAYIPLLEVLPAYRRQGIGRGLVTRMLSKLRELYAIDLLCDRELQPFYAACGMMPAAGMLLRHYERQAGSAAPSAT